MKSCLSRLLTIVFGLFVALLIAEIGIRAAYRALPQPLQIALRDVRITPFTDARLVPVPIWADDNDYQTITRPGLQEVTAYGSPEIAFKVSTYSWWGGRVGFRTPQPTDGHVDGVVLGDSFAFCFTDAPDCWVDRLSAAGGLRLADLGQPVTGSVSHARIFKTFAAPIKPGLVIWQFFGNDFNDDYGLARLNGTAQTPPEPVLATEPPLPQGFPAWLRENSAVYALLSALVRRSAGVQQFVDPYHLSGAGLDLWYGQTYVRDAFDLSAPRNQEGERLSQAAILETRALVEGYGGKFVIVLMPTKEETYAAQTEPALTATVLAGIRAPREHLNAFCAAQQLTCLDLLPTLQAQAASGTQGYYPRDMHLNPAGNAAVADALLKYLRDQKLIGGP
jgi:hypothetical protein